MSYVRIAVNYPADPCAPSPPPTVGYQPPTHKACSSVRNRKPKKDEELASFLKNDQTTFPDTKETVIYNKRNFACPVLSFIVDNIFIVQSLQLRNGIPLFIVKISETFLLVTIYSDVKCFVTSHWNNRVTTIDSWSKQHSSTLGSHDSQHYWGGNGPEI